MKRNKPYRPKPIGTARLFAALGLAPKLGDDQLVDLGVFVWQSLDLFAKGKATADHYGALANAANLSMAFCERGIEPDKLADVQAAQVMLIDVQMRFNQHGKYILKANELEAFRGLVALHERQIERVGQAETVSVLTELRRRLTRRHVLTAKQLFPAAA